MTYENDRTEFIPVELLNNKIIKVEVAHTGREDVAFDILPFGGELVSCAKTFKEKINKDKKVKNQF